MCLSKGHPEAMKAPGAGRKATPPLSDGSAMWIPGQGWHTWSLQWSFVGY